MEKQEKFVSVFESNIWPGQFIVAYKDSGGKHYLLQNEIFKDHQKARKFANKIAKEIGVEVSDFIPERYSKGE